MSLKTWVVEKMAGSKMAVLYDRFWTFMRGKKTNLVGLSLVLQGVVALIDASQGTGVGDILDLIQDPAVETISEGLGLMALRAGVKKMR